MDITLDMDPEMTVARSHEVAHDVKVDIDWVLSSYGAGVYQVWKNQGGGTFVLDQTMPSVQAMGQVTPASPSWFSR